MFHHDCLCTFVTYHPPHEPASNLLIAIQSALSSPASPVSPQSAASIPAHLTRCFASQLLKSTCHQALKIPCHQFICRESRQSQCQEGLAFSSRSKGLRSGLPAAASSPASRGGHYIRYRDRSRRRFVQEATGLPAASGRASSDLHPGWVPRAFGFGDRREVRPEVRPEVVQTPARGAAGVAAAMNVEGRAALLTCLILDTSNTFSKAGSLLRRRTMAWE